MSDRFYSFIRTYFVLAILVVFCLPSQAFSEKKDKSIEEIQEEIKSIDVQMKFLKIKVDEQKKKSRNIEKRIEKTKQQIQELGLQINQLSKNQTETTEQIKRLIEDNAASKSQLKELMTRYKNRLVQLHKIRQGTLVSSVLFAKDLNSFLNRYQMVKYLLESDKALIENLKSKEEKVRKISETLSEKNRALESGKDEIADKRKKLAKEQATYKAMLNNILAEKKIYLQKEKKLGDSKKLLEKQIQETSKIVSSPEFEDDLLNKTDIATTPKKNVKSVSAIPAVYDSSKEKKEEKYSPNTLSDSVSEVAKQMDFTWPIADNLRGNVTEKGDENSCALIIKPIADAEVLAAARGKVMYKGALSGLGDVVILGHQRGFSSVYARLDNVWVGLNEVVDKGTVIGKIDGGNSNSFLHFEIRFGGKKMPPLTYLPK